jgi:hypothetical protein
MKCIAKKAQAFANCFSSRSKSKGGGETDNGGRRVKATTEKLSNGFEGKSKVSSPMNNQMDLVHSSVKQFRAENNALGNNAPLGILEMLRIDA